MTTPEPSSRLPDPPSDPRLRRLYESARRVARLRVLKEHAERTARMLDLARVKKPDPAPADGTAGDPADR